MLKLLLSYYVARKLIIHVALGSAVHVIILGDCDFGSFTLIQKFSCTCEAGDRIKLIIYQHDGLFQL